MKNICLGLILLMFWGCDNSTNETATESYAPFNFDAVYDFWEVVDTLKNNKYPSKTLWDKLTDNNGYKVLESANGITPKMIRERMEICFHPDFNEVKDSILKHGDVFQKSTYLHLIETDLSRENLRGHIDWLKKENVHDAMVKKTNEFLPKKYHNYKVPVINMILFGENAHANNSGVCMDLLLSYFADKIDQGGILAHELHHYVLDNYQAENKIKNDTIDSNAVLHDDTKKLVRKIVYQSQKEGVANLIDKEKGYLNPEMKTTSPEYLSYIRDEFAKGRMRIIQLNERLVSIAENKNMPYSWDFVSEAMPFYGHVVGFYMAKIINENGYHNDLMITIEKPQYFFELYNKVVGQKNIDAPLFDNKAIELISISH